jgi:hypothetical protein
MLSAKKHFAEIHGIAKRKEREAVHASVSTWRWSEAYALGSFSLFGGRGRLRKRSNRRRRAAAGGFTASAASCSGVDHPLFTNR